jgi:hypothetical protein
MIREWFYKIIGAFTGNPSDSKAVVEENEELIKQVLAEKRKAISDVRRTNDTLKIMLEKGEFQIRIIRNEKKKK